MAQRAERKRVRPALSPAEVLADVDAVYEAIEAGAPASQISQRVKLASLKADLLKQQKGDKQVDVTDADLATRLAVLEKSLGFRENRSGKVDETLFHGGPLAPPKPDAKPESQKMGSPQPESQISRQSALPPPSASGAPKSEVEGLWDRIRASRGNYEQPAAPILPAEPIRTATCERLGHGEHVVPLIRVPGMKPPRYVDSMCPKCIHEAEQYERKIMGMTLPADPRSWKN